MQHWSVTLTGEVAPDAQPEVAWQKVREALACDEERFRHGVHSRLPVSFHSGDEDAARRQCQALQACGVEAVLLADEGQRAWVRDDERTCGPVSLGWAARAVAAGRWNRWQLACPEGEQRWRPLAELLPADAQGAPAGVDMPPPPPGSVGGGPATGAARLPTHRQTDGLHAGFWMRVAAYLVDSLIASAASLVIVLLIMLVSGLGMTPHEPVQQAGWVMLYLLFYPLLIVGVWLYFALFEASRHQATPGKMALGLRVTDEQGRRIGFGRATGRYFGKILSGMILDIGYMMAGWTERKQGLHDMVAGCCVVRRSGLDAWQARGAASDSGAPGRGLPGWAIALIVVAALFVLVLPVLGMLAAISVPMYENFLIKAQVAEGATLAEQARTAVEAHVAKQGGWPSDNMHAGLPGPDAMSGLYVSSVVVRQGMVLITYGSKANDRIRGDHLLFTPRLKQGKVRWQCSSPDIDSRYLPSACRRQDVPDAQ